MEYLSYSRLSLLETCGLRFFYEYVLQLEPEDTVPTYHASFGKIVHTLYEQHANTSGESEFGDLKSLYDSAFKVMMPEFPDRDTAVSFYRRGVRAIARFSRYRVADVVSSEREFLLDVGADTPPVKGFIDRVIYTKEHGYMVADLKTGKVFAGRNPRKMRQLVIYSLACEQIYEEPAQSGYFDFIVYGEREWVDISGEDREQTKAWVREKWEQIRREEFSPRYSAGYCSQYCPFRSRCPEYSRRAAKRMAQETGGTMYDRHASRSPGM